MTVILSFILRCCNIHILFSRVHTFRITNLAILYFKFEDIHKHDLGVIITIILSYHYIEMWRYQNLPFPPIPKMADTLTDTDTNFAEIIYQI